MAMGRHTRSLSQHHHMKASAAYPPGGPRREDLTGFCHSGPRCNQPRHLSSRRAGREGCEP
jgi:hypothetical protein